MTQVDASDSEQFSEKLPVLSEVYPAPSLEDVDSTSLLSPFPTPIALSPSSSL